MTEKRFKVNEKFDWAITDTVTNENYCPKKEIVDLVNELFDENEQLKKENKILSGLYDLDTLSDKFYVDGHWLKNKHSMGIIANMFNYHEAHLVCEILNDLLPYKLLVRKHKQDLESIYGKSIKEQLEEVIK